ncbi:hypothetical protein GCM10018793_67230 [Streptomyces sulfonofaciens]|uniref:Uncharacterized protein n=1 Tax=Streptomyces sulfonofaciens TaxID=68272 RepID=A0A919GQY8_9ACTN|nr:hypothetical protein [Streptomyces sulfonofaciens]GHH88245.1 hypothetical protein GCM10018793_67230 [Streptomyces sulfonofaciens]
MPDLTPHELELLAEAAQFRGYTPRDDVPEPDQGPTGPAGASAPPPARTEPDRTLPLPLPPTDE